MGRSEVYPDHTALMRAAAQHFATIASDAVVMRGKFMVALAGGNTPRDLYLLLAQRWWRTRIPWDKSHIFFGDERCVPAQHPESNYRMVHEALLGKLVLPAENVHRMAGELDPQVAAAAYQQEIVRTFGTTAKAPPRFDLILLGLGSDGHTASLFPGTAALHESEKLVVANYVERLKSFRLTLTLPVCNHARYIIFLVAGESKADIVNEVIGAPDRPGSRYPAQLIRPTDGAALWLLDRAAGHKLPPVVA